MQVSDNASLIVDDYLIVGESGALRAEKNASISVRNLNVSDNSTFRARSSTIINVAGDFGLFRGGTARMDDSTLNLDLLSNLYVSDTSLLRINGAPSLTFGNQVSVHNGGSLRIQDPATAYSIPNLSVGGFSNVKLTGSGTVTAGNCTQSNVYAPFALPFTCN